MNGIKAFFTQSITMKIAASIAVMLILAVFTIGAIFTMVNAQKTDSTVINEAGRLRMFSQKMTKAAFMIATGDQTARDELLAILDDYELDVRDRRIKDQRPLVSCNRTK